MSYLIDTNICIYLMNHRPPEVIANLLSKVKDVGVGNIAVSSITVAELQYGVAKSKNIKKNQRRLDEFLLPFEILPFAELHTLVYGELRADLSAKGLIIGALDMLIAAHALAENMTVVTNNEKEFNRVAELKVENWLT